MNRNIQWPFTRLELAFGVGVWALFTLMRGYSEGGGDHFEFANAVRAFADPTWLPNDLFLQSLREQALNERTLFCALLWPFSAVLQYAWLPLHMVASVLLVVGALRLARLLVPHDFWALAGVLLGTVGVYGFTTGGTTLLENNFQASGISDCCAVWALWASLQGRHRLAFGCLVFSTWMHPLLGTCHTLLVGLLWLGQWRLGSLPLKRVAWMAAGWLVLAGSYVIGIRLAYEGGSSTLPDSEFFRLVFQYRAPHHFLPSAFSLREWLVTVPLITAAVWLFYRSRSPLLWPVMGFVGLAVVYVVGVEGFQSFQVGSSQWFRVSPLVALVGSVALAGLVAARVSGLNWSAHRYAVLSACVGLVSIIIVYVGHDWPKLRDREYYLPGLLNRHADYRMARWVDEHLPPTALLVQPVEYNTLKYWGNRASWVDYKGFARGRRLLPVWYNRMQQVFGTTAETPRAQRQAIAQQHLHNASPGQLNAIAQQGVTHIVADTALPPAGLQRLHTEGRFGVYAFQP